MKIRGFRVELGEIESALAAHPDVQSCAVTVQEDRNHDQCLVAFVVLRGQRAPSTRSVRAWLARTLPPYMLPSRVARLSALPLTPEGKIDRHALDRLPADELPSGTPYVAPRTPLEVQLTSIWQDVLRQEPIGIHDHFLDLGGHSLLALAVVSEIRSRVGRRVPQTWLMAHPTIAELAARIETVESVPEASDTIRAVDRGGELPMSHGQRRMWLLQHTLPDAATYNVPVVHRLRGPVDENCLAACWRTLLAQHEILRTLLIQQDEALLQQVLPVDSAAVPWQAVDWRHMTSAEQADALREESRRPFDLATTPLWRALWATVGEDEHILALTFHHSVIDEWSLRILFGELQQLYAAGADASAARLPPLSVQYADFAQWQQEQLGSGLQTQQRSYWRKQLAALPPALELPADGLRPVLGSGRGAVHRFMLPEELVTALRNLAREANTSLFTLVLASYQVWLYRYTGQQDLIVGTPASNRNHLDLHTCLGFFLNTLPMRAQLNDDDTFRQVLARTQHTVLSGLEHSDLPFEDLVALAVRDRDALHTPLYQVMLVLVEQPWGPWQLGSTPAQALAVHTGTSKHDLILSITAHDESCSCELEYATDLFTAGTAERMARHWVELLHSIAGQPDANIGQLNLLPAEERRQLLVTWNGAARDYPRDTCIHQLFEQQAQQTPDAVAVVADHQTLTYGELNRAADRLAQRLVQLGVGRRARVAVYLDRSVEFITSILAVLKVGAAYVPLDRNYPADRLRFMLVDSAAEAIISAGPVPEGLDGGGLARLDVLQESASTEVFCRDDLPAQCSADDLAYVMYTSGSTGRPKGVGVPHRGVVRLVRSQEYAAFDAQQRFLFLAPTCFDASTFELWGPLLNGATCVVFCPSCRTSKPSNNLCVNNGSRASG